MVGFFSHRSKVYWCAFLASSFLGATASYSNDDACGDALRPPETKVWSDANGQLIFSKESPEFIAWRNRTPPHIPDSAFAFARLSEEKQMANVVAAKRGLDRSAEGAGGDSSSAHSLSKGFLSLEADISPYLQALSHNKKLHNKGFKEDLSFHFKFLRVGFGAQGAQLSLVPPRLDHATAFDALVQSHSNVVFYGSGVIDLDVIETNRDGSNPEKWLLIVVRITAYSKAFLSDGAKGRLGSAKDSLKLKSNLDLVYETLTPLLERFLPGQYELVREPIDL